ncbi:sporulation protein [Acinetobacter sichuanensis]|uniref:sporulation protein n=1 Tax=Acinetobacter sichuanensis TaxID=2136183 RepID=UPI00280DE60C|nr:sporulation protein [Acinetobacter sichuanensis]MDQ9019536.1 sporulation protein [Acinetobacter sichuanensis]
MFSKLMSNLGLQGVEVNTCIYTSTPQAGQIVNGEIIFKGAASNKNINGIYLKLMTSAEVESSDHEFNQDLTIQQWHVSGAFELKANQSHSFPFSIQLPFETPITEIQCRHNKTRVWLHTHLDIDWAVDATDKDNLNIAPTPTMQAFLQAMQQCGFFLATADVEKGQLRGGHYFSTIGCYQELEFLPTQHFSGINEVEVSFVAQEHQTHVMLEIDRKFRGDQLRSITIPHHQISTPHLVQQIKQLLNI